MRPRRFFGEGKVNPMEASVILYGERRRSERRRALFPVEIHKDEGAPMMALLRELSHHGAQILTRVPVALGSQVAVMLYVDDPRHAYPATGKVVRSAIHPEPGLWSYVIAVAFDESITALDSEVNALSERQRQIGLT